MNHVPCDPPLETIPSLEDWGTILSANGRYVFENFNGKTIQAAVRVFEYQLSYREDFEELLSMNIRVFRYYFRAFMIYLLSRKSRRDPDGPSCFLSMVRGSIEAEPDTIQPLWPDVCRVLDHIAANQEAYGADLETYGSFPKRTAEIFASAPATFSKAEHP